MFSLDNDKALLVAAQSTMEDVLRADAEELMTIKQNARLFGCARMTHRPEDGVVDPDHRVHGARNLHVTGGSVRPSQGLANPALTIVSLAAGAADRMIEQAQTGS